MAKVTATRKPERKIAISLEISLAAKQAIDAIARQEQRSVAYLGREAFDLLLADRKNKAKAAA